MPANVDQMFSVRQMPWHREGTVLDDYPQTWEEARKLAGLDWDPIAAPATFSGMEQEQFQQLVAQIMFDAETDDSVKPEMLWQLHKIAMYEDGGFKRIYRSDSGATLAYTMDTYDLIPNSDFGEILEAVLEVGSGQVKLETGGCLEGGKKVWMLAVMDEPIEIPGDSSLTMPYLALTSRHDSNGSCSLRSTAVRIVCANTFSAAEAEGQRTGTVFQFVHRGSWRDKIEQARNAVMNARAQFAQYKELADDLIKVAVTPVQTDLFVKAMFPMPKLGTVSDLRIRNVEASQERLKLILNSETVEGAGIGGTLYGWAQAAGEYYDWARAANGGYDQRVNRNLLSHEKGKARAIKIGRDVLAAV